MKFYLTISLIVMSNILYGQIYTTIDGGVNFVSDAPLELIEASSDQMQGLIDIKNKTFAFKIYIKSFDGFNNALQKVHFYENYMEANKFPIATFKGKLLEPIKNGRAMYRAKGTLDIHGQVQERIIEVDMNFNEGQISYNSTFVVPLLDHDIQLPRIVYQKVSEHILVKVYGSMQLKR